MYSTNLCLNFNLYWEGFCFHQTEMCGLLLYYIVIKILWYCSEIQSFMSLSVEVSICIILEKYSALVIIKTLNVLVFCLSYCLH